MPDITMCAECDRQAVARAPGVLHERGAEALRAADFDGRERLALRERRVDRPAFDVASLGAHEQRVRAPGPEPLPADATRRRWNGLIANERFRRSGGIDRRERLPVLLCAAEAARAEQSTGHAASHLARALPPCRAVNRLRCAVGTIFIEDVRPDVG